MKEIKILGIIDDHPFDFRTWSGSSVYFFNSLMASGHLFQAISALPSKIIRYYYKGLCFNPDMSKWKFRYHINIDYYHQMTQSALKKSRKLNENDYNVIVQIGAWYDLTKRRNKLTVSYHDGNLYTLLKSPYGYPQIRKEYIERALRYEKSLYEKMDYIFPMSHWLANSFINDFGIKPNKVFPVGAGINLPYIREISDKSYDRPRILFVGKNFERKGGLQLLEAFKIVKKNVKEATLTIIGPMLRDLPEGVRCLNFIRKDSKEGIDLLLNEYSLATIFVLPSLYEPFGIVFAEAMAHKLPCIGTNICAMPEIIDNGKNGYLVPPGNIEVLAEKILDLVKEPALCKRMGENGYEKYLKNYTWDRVTKKITDQIEKVQ